MNAKSNQYSCPKAYEVLRGSPSPLAASLMGHFWYFPFAGEALDQKLTLPGMGSMPSVFPDTGRTKHMALKAELM